MKQKKLKKILFMLAEMCNTTACKDCLLSFDNNKCILHHASLTDMAAGFFLGNEQLEGAVWIRFKDLEAFKAATSVLTDHLDTNGDYDVTIYLEDSNRKAPMEAGLRANDESLEDLTQIYGNDNVKLVMKVPKDVLSYF